MGTQGIMPGLSIFFIFSLISVSLGTPIKMVEMEEVLNNIPCRMFTLVNCLSSQYKKRVPPSTPGVQWEAIVGTDAMLDDSNMKLLRFGKRADVQDRPE